MASLPHMMEKVFESVRAARKLSEPGDDFEEIVRDLADIEYHWKSKRELVNIFLQYWDVKFNVRGLEEYIKAVKKIVLTDKKTGKSQEKVVLSLVHFLETDAKKRHFSLTAHKMLDHFVGMLEKILKALEKNLTAQLKWIEENAEQDIGIAQYRMHEFIDLLEEEAKILSLENSAIKELQELYFDRMKTRHFYEDSRPSAVNYLKSGSYAARKSQLMVWGFNFYENPELGNLIISKWEDIPIVDRLFKDRIEECLIAKGFTSCREFLNESNFKQVAIILARISNLVFEIKDFDLILNYFKMCKSYDMFLQVSRIIIKMLEARLKTFANKHARFYVVFSASHTPEDFYAGEHSGVEYGICYLPLFDLKDLKIGPNPSAILDAWAEIVKISGKNLPLVEYNLKIFAEFIKDVESLLKMARVLADVADNSGSEVGLVLDKIQNYKHLIRNTDDLGRIGMILANISKKSGRNTKEVFSCLSTFDYFIKKEADLSRVGNALAGIVSHLGENIGAVLRNLFVLKDLIKDESDLLRIGKTLAELAEHSEKNAKMVLDKIPVFKDSIKDEQSLRFIGNLISEIFNQAANLLDYLDNHKEVLQLCVTSFSAQVPEESKNSKDLPKLLKKIVTYDKIKLICARGFFNGIFEDAELKALLGSLDMRILTTGHPDDVKQLIKTAQTLGEEKYLRWLVMQNMKALKTLKSYGIKLPIWLGIQQLHLVQRVIAPGISNISPDEYKKRAIGEQVELFLRNMHLIFSQDVIPDDKARSELFGNISNKDSSILSASKKDMETVESFIKTCASKADKIPDVIKKAILPQIQDDAKMQKIVTRERLQNFFGARGDFEQVAESITKIIAGKTGEAKMLNITFNVSRKNPLNLQLKTKWTQGMTNFFQPSVLTIGNDGGCCVAMGGVNEFAGYNFFLDADALLVNILDNNKKRAGMILAFAAIEGNEPILALNTVETPYRADS